MGIFEIIGPIMIGPSSSHTAGAVRIGKYARRIYGVERPFDLVEIDLFNSFSESGKGHGTDLALLSGILCFNVDDERILKAFDIAHEMGINYKINFKGIDEDFPENTAKITFYNGETSFYIFGESIGGGLIHIFNVNGYRVSLFGRHPVLIVVAKDVRGIVAHVSKVILDAGINIAKAEIERDSSIGESLSVFKLDADFPKDMIPLILENKNIKEAITVERLEEL
ncbi:L-serine ammonia-lyase, iron-sulfur-dependent subunit beta [Caldisericum exile]|uniref:L-serine dehydratase n=1 Tax=Caldisericum exile (strain DSM 21853 / NBRC 104410 / AZM16c01) TaxID=511051 RepID=A0A7U6GDX6_CALEA|nr:L-serine ammonia-lyase, iron-sulfur-dependent subunit beta [Caldisericum exile]BAL80633.1 L-serine dehydratase, beta chain [Caldisericum exile AZM16c01]